MDEFTKILVRSILARNALFEHKCHHSWCARIEPGCDEAVTLCLADGLAFELAHEAIIKRGADLEVECKSHAQ